MREFLLTYWPVLAAVVMVPSLALAAIAAGRAAALGDEIAERAFEREFDPAAAQEREALAFLRPRTGEVSPAPRSAPVVVPTFPTPKE